MYEEQYDLVAHVNLESSSYYLDRYLFSPEEQALNHFKYAREEVLLGLVMMDLFACGKNHNLQSPCSTIHSTIINSKNQPVEPKTLKEELLKVVDEGWKSSQKYRTFEYHRVSRMKGPQVFGLTRIQFVRAKRVDLCFYQNETQ